MGLERIRPRFPDCHRCILFTGQIVTLSHPIALFFSPHRTQQPLARTIGFCWVTHDPASETLWKWWAWGLGLSHKNFSPFHECFPPEVDFQPLWHAMSSNWPHFEHCDIKMGCLDIECLYSTLCPNISMYSNLKFLLKMAQCSVWGVVIPVANLFAKDCISLLTLSLWHHHLASLCLTCQIMGPQNLNPLLPNNVWSLSLTVETIPGSWPSGSRGFK